MAYGMSHYAKLTVTVDRTFLAALLSLAWQRYHGPVAGAWTIGR